MSAALRLRRLYGVYPRPYGPCLQANDSTYTVVPERHEVLVSICPPDAPKVIAWLEACLAYAVSLGADSVAISLPPATASAEGAQVNVPPFPATASAEGGAQRVFNGAPVPRDGVGGGGTG
jgi:hypothetical protein